MSYWVFEKFQYEEEEEEKILYFFRDLHLMGFTIVIF